MANSKLNIEPEKIHLEFIEEISVGISESNFDDNSPTKISTSIAHISGHKIDEKKFFFGLKLVLLVPDSESIRCHFRYNFYYIIDNLEDMFIENDENEPIFQKIFVATIAGISYSTLRGIIYEKLRNTDWGNLIIPVINPSTILDSWIKKE